MLPQEHKERWAAIDSQRSTRHRYDVYVLSLSVTREKVRSDQVEWRCVVLATSRREALEKCLPDLEPLRLRALACGYRRLSVFVGDKTTTGRASRMSPISIPVD